MWPRATQVVPGGADQALPGAAAFWEPGGDEITLTMKLKRRPIPKSTAPKSKSSTPPISPMRCTSRRRQQAQRDDFPRHVSVWIDVAPEVAYAIAADPEQLPRWASGLAGGWAAADRRRLGRRFADGTGDGRVRAAQRLRGARPCGADAVGRGGVQPVAGDPRRVRASRVVRWCSPCDDETA